MIELIPMNQKDFQKYCNVSIPNYAQEHVNSGNWNEDDALNMAQETFNKLLPKGLNTPDHYFFNIEKQESKEIVGILWFAVEQRQGGKLAFLYDIGIYPEYRRSGFGLETMKKFEEKVSKLGLNKIMFHVFGHNTSARKMYEKLDYEVKNLIMAKELDN